MSASSQAIAIQKLISDVSKINENSQNVLDLLNRTMDSMIPQVVAQLGDEEKSHVLQCLYIGLAKPENNGKLLKWFQCITEASNIGTVIRAVNAF